MVFGAAAACGAPAAPSCAAAGSGAPGVRRGKRPARCGFDCTEYHTGVPCIFSGGPRVVFRCANDVGKPFPDNIFLCLCGDFGGVAGRGSAVAAFGFVFGRADSAAVLPAAGSNAGCRARSAADVPVVLDAAAADTCAAALQPGAGRPCYLGPVGARSGAAAGAADFSAGQRLYPAVLGGQDATGRDRSGAGKYAVCIAVACILRRRTAAGDSRPPCLHRPYSAAGGIRN